MIRRAFSSCHDWCRLCVCCLPPTLLLPLLLWGRVPGRMLARMAPSAGILGRLLAQQLGGASMAAAALGNCTATSASCSSALLARIGAAAARTFATNSHDIFNVHKHSAENNWSTEFDFTPANYKKARRRSLACSSSALPLIKPAPRCPTACQPCPPACTPAVCS